MNDISSPVAMVKVLVGFLSQSMSSTRYVRLLYLKVREYTYTLVLNVIKRQRELFVHVANANFKGPNVQGKQKNPCYQLEFKRISQIHNN